MDECERCGERHDIHFPCYAIEGARIFPRRSGTQFVAGPFTTEAEARAAWELLTTPAQGTA